MELCHAARITPGGVFLFPVRGKNLLPSTAPEAIAFGGVGCVGWEGVGQGLSGCPFRA
jgi:hypothetical protein